MASDADKMSIDLLPTCIVSIVIVAVMTASSQLLIILYAVSVQELDDRKYWKATYGLNAVVACEIKLFQIISAFVDFRLK